MHEYKSNPYSNFEGNELKQLKYFGMLAANLISIFHKKRKSKNIPLDLLLLTNSNQRTMMKKWKCLYNVYIYII